MNERIRELAEQSQKEVWGNDPYNGSPDFIGYELDAEKFAQLIVKKCAEIADSGVDITESHLIGNDILEHFGVEE